MKKSFLKIIFLAFLLFWSSVLPVKANNGDSIAVKIVPAENYPRWLVTKTDTTFQTSGITFINKSEDGTLQFLLADDIGKIHRLFIADDTVFTISDLKFSSEVNKYLESFPKLDFEEIFFDKYTRDVYITIEGNNEDHLSFHGVYKLKFKDDDIYQDSVIQIEKIKFKPDDSFYKNLNPNIGYEGFTADENYFYLGLENEQVGDGEFTTNSFLRIADKRSHCIIKEISTGEIGIGTICGLYSDQNLSLWGVDRNAKRVFKLIIDEYFNIAEINFFELKTIIPGHNNFEYVGSVESITVVAEKFLFMVDDPWFAFFTPPDEILNQLDETTTNNFKKFIPVIYKYKLD